MKKLISLLAVGFLAISGIAVIAQTVAVPQVQTISPTADRIQIIPRGAPSAQSVYASPAQITATKGYYKSSPLTNFTFTFAANQAIAAFTPAGTLSTATVTLAAIPSDGTEECIFSTQTLTSLTINANAGQSIANAVTTLTANGKVCYLYGQSTATWNRTN